MALVLANRVQESATANTTVSFTLTGAVTGFQSFAVIGNTNTTYYSATDGSGNWEVGLGTYSTTGPTLTRTTVYASSNSGSAVTFSGVVSVFVTYPSGRSVNLDTSGNVSALGTVASGTWQGSTIGVAYGGTGVTTSSGANSVVLRDSNSNITVNRLSQGIQTITASGGTTVLTAASQFNQALVGTGGHTFQLPDATTLTDTTAFQFNNNATGTLTIINNASGAVGTIAPGGAAGIALLSNATVAGTWDVHAYIPENVTWGTNALALGSTVISGGTWQGGTIQSGYGGTGLTTFTGANNALYSTGSTTLTAGTLPVAAGGTGATATPTNGQLLIGNGTNYSVATLGSGTGISTTTGSGTLTINNTGVTSFSAGTTGLTPSTGTTGAVTLAGTLAIANGGTGQTTAQGAMNTFAGAVTSGSYLRGNGTNVVMSAIQAADVPTLNQNTTGTAGGLSGTPNITVGTINATSGTFTGVLTPTGGIVNGAVFNKTGTGSEGGELQFEKPTTGTLSGNVVIDSFAQSIRIFDAGGTNRGASLDISAQNAGVGSTILTSSTSAASFPTLNQNTTGTAGNVTGVVAIANGGTGQTTQQAAINALVGTQTANRVLRSNGTNMSLSQVALATDVSGTLPVTNGGTGQTSYTDGQLLIGNSTGNTLTKATLTAGSGVTITNGAGSITIAASGGGGGSPATPTAAGIVFGRTTNCCAGRKTALGYTAGLCAQGAYAVAIGGAAGAACQGTTAVAVGNAAGFFNQGGGAVAIGCIAGNLNQGSGAVAIGPGAGSTCQHAGSIAIGASTSTTGTCQTHIGPIRNVGGCTGGASSLFYLPCSREIVYGTGGGGFVVGANGNYFATTATLCTACSYCNVVVGNFAQLDFNCFGPTPAIYAVSIGYQASGSSGGGYFVSVGACAGSNYLGTAIGYGTCAANGSVAIGAGPIGFLGSPGGSQAQGTGAVAVGQAFANANYAVAVGKATAAGTNSVAIGMCATVFNCNSIAIGAGTAASACCQTHIGPIRYAITCFALYYCPTTREITYG